MAKIYSTGPAHIFAAVGGNLNAKTALYLGTGMTPPDIDIDEGIVPIKNDLGGEVHGIARLWLSQEGLITVVMNRMNWANVQRVLTMPFFTGTYGSNAVGDTGTIMEQEGATYPVWITFPNKSIKASQADLPNGYRFFSCAVEGRPRISPGNRDKRVAVTWRATRQFSGAAAPANPLTSPALGGSPGVGVAFSNAPRLFDHDITGLPAVD